MAHDPWGTPVVLLIEDDAGQVTQSVRRLSGVPRVCIASSRALHALLPLADRGSIVLNRDAPFVLLIRLVDEALRDAPRAPQPGTDLGGRLRTRIEECRALDRLTTQESETLQALMEGATAAEIAARSCRSIHTVRSQIKAVRTKLGVSSQTAATALAERVGHHHAVERARAQFTNCGDEVDAKEH
ncbi:hypothetical protein N869_13785 [Cellulomonas bogoriensis 69B4 = DSM 16987]|uniref:HTH luxR-type domain-containing protein n=1 Tax=Cellulomonas bogoriensis 69B4 = DSM 16987 TaxID=1386082 RepID=A0A0A0C235_9CELL|nr:hypothetical protein N869_13785 [Cellulomonas bogoriensis 69B4 = DSM 16987]